MAELDHTQRNALHALEQDTTTIALREIRWDKDCKSPKFISGTLSAPSQDEAEDIARRFLERTANLVALPENVQEQLDLANVTTDTQGYRHVTFQQILNSIPVFEGSIQVHINPAGQVVSFKANRATQVDASLTPTLTAEQAVERAKQEFGEPVSSRVQSQTALLLYKDDADRMYLAWHVQIFSDQDMATYHYFLDAHSGRLLYKYNDLRHVMARQTYTANTTETLPGQLLISEGATSHADDVAWDAHANAGIVYEYYRTRFDRDSYDNQGAPLRSTVHFSKRYNNAFWTSQMQQMVYGDGDGVQFSPLSGALDVVGHELTHAITSHTARFVYAEEAGALDESFADFFGVMISNGDPITNWQMGEHVYTPGRPGDALRDISDPPQERQPDHTSTQRRLQPGEFPECNPRSSRYNDNGFVHTNSGIPNKAGFLMVAGGTHHGIQVQGLGKATAEQIMYLALTAYLQSATPSRWTIRQARLATIDACQQLYPGDAAKLATVMNAWAAVGVGEAASPSPSENLFRVETAPHLAIPDNQPDDGIVSVLTVPQAGRMSSVNVSVDILHSYIGDLRLVLTAPNGTNVVLHNRTGASTDDLMTTYDAATTPGLAALNGTPAQGDWRLSVTDLAALDSGQLRRWSLEIGIEADAAVIREEAVAALAIPDNDPTGSSSNIAIAQTGTARDIRLSVDITHTFIGDLQVVLVAPTGQQAVLHDRLGGGQDNLIQTYDTASTPVLTSLVGLAIQGNWTLRVMDLAGRDIGKLNKWSIELTV